MSWSRLISILSAIGGTLTSFAAFTNQIPPKWALGIAMAALAINTFTERAQGGLSEAKDPRPRND